MADLQKKRTRELAREGKDPVRHAMFPLDEEVHLPQDLLDAINFASENEAGAI